MLLSYLNLTTTDPAFNLAVEQYVFDHLPRDRMYFMLWQNENAIIIGKHQNTYAEINTEYVAENNIKVVRRLSGGGAVYHDLGNLNFTFITDAAQENGIDFHAFCVPIVRALKKLGVNAEINGRNDMLIDGKKFSGNSQYIRNGRVMHHGTLLFSSNLEVITNALNVDPAKIKAKGIKSVRSRVTNIAEHMQDEIGLQCFREALLSSILLINPGTEYILTDEDLEEIGRIKEERYDTWQWNYGTSGECTLSKKDRIEGCGSVEIRYVLEHGLIKSMQLYGDFFSIRDPAQLCRQLIGTSLTKEALFVALANVEPSAYILGLDKTKFIDLLCK